MGGLGNCLFQLEHAKRQTSESGEVIAYTNIILSKNINRLFGWTYHQPVIQDLNIKGIKFQQRNVILFFIDLIKLFFAFRLKDRQFLKVSWENHRNTDGINFGYFQYSREGKSSFSLNLKNKTFKNVVHLRLGDSPTMNSDLITQTKLMKTLNKEHYLVLTNDVNFAKDWFVDKDLNITIQRNSILQDFKILLNTETLIGPQSTFSWMAAYLSNKIKFYYVNEKFWKDLKFNKKIKVITYNHQGNI